MAHPRPHRKRLPMNDLLCIQNLTKHYDGFSLQNVNLSVPVGSVVGFIGANGAGKTTTLKTVLGLTLPDDGTIDLFGERIYPDTPATHIATLKQRIGVVFDTCPFQTELTVATIGKLMAHVYSTWDAAAFRTLIEAFELPADHTVKSLSRGMGMKLSLACALAHNPNLLILDEATAGLDPLARDQALDALRTFMHSEERGILMSSHITSDLEKIADYIVCIDHGRVVFTMDKDAICDMAGIAHCRFAEFDDVMHSGFFEPHSLHFRRNPYGTDILVPDRFVFAERFGAIALDRADIDAYMALMLKGETL